MSVKTAAQLIIDVNTFLPDNTSELISASDERDRFIDIIDSYLNKTDFFTGLPTEYTAGDGTIQAFNFSPLWNITGNTLASRGTFGSISGAFGWDYEIDGVKVGEWTNGGVFSALNGLESGSYNFSPSSWYAGGVVNGMALQNTTTNARSSFALIPNGTSTISDLWLFSDSNTTSNYSALAWGYEATNDAWAFNVAKNGTGTAKRIYFNATASELIGTANLILNIDGSSELNGDLRFLTDSIGSVYIDRTTATEYRLYVDGGVLLIEVV